MEKQYPGPYCREINLSIEELNNLKKIKPIDNISLKNGVVFEILNTCKNLTEVVTILNLIKPKLFELANVSALKSKLNRLKDVRKKFVAKKKVKGYKTLSEFMETPFGPPASKIVSVTAVSSENCDGNHDTTTNPQTQTGTNLSGSNPSQFQRSVYISEKLEKHPELSVTVNSTLLTPSPINQKQVAEVSEITQPSLDTEVSQKTINTLCYQYSKLQKNSNRIEKEIQQKLEKVSLLDSRIGHYAVKNVNKRDETAKKNLSLLRASERSGRHLKSLLEKSVLKYQDSQKQLAAAKLENKHLCEKLKQLEHVTELCEQERKKKLSAQKSASYMRLELRRLKTEACDHETIADQKSLIRTKDYQIDDLQMEMTDLKDRLQMLYKTKNDDGSYNDRIRLCILELTGLEVAVEKVSPVIQAVLKHMTGAQIPKSELPNRNTVQTIVDQGHFLAKTYISERIDNCKNWGLHRDGTSRRKQKILDTSVALDSGDIISLGFDRVAHETAAVINSVTKKHLNELASMHSSLSNDEDTQSHKEEFLAMSLQKLSFTMSDRASNEKLANKILNDWREEILQNFTGDVETVHTFYCMAHVLLGFHNYIVPDMKEKETEIVAKDGPLGRDRMPIFKAWSKKQSATERAVRTTSDIFGPAGDHNGLRDRWEAHCSANAIKSLIGNYRDNRFNAIFQTSAAVSVHKNQFLSVLGTVSAPNLKLQSVKADLECNTICTVLQCLGLFFVKVTSPYWNLVTLGTVPYLELYHYIGNLKQYLESCAEEPALLLNKERFWGDGEFVQVQHMRQYDSLFIIVEGQRELLFDSIKLVSLAMIKVIKKQLADFLPGGQFYRKANKNDSSRTNFAQLTNLGCEHHFGDLDSSQKRRPSASMHHHSSVQLLKRNRLGLMQWFDEMSPDKRTDLLKSARKGGHILRQIHLEEEKSVCVDIHKEMLIEKEKKKGKKRKNNGKGDDRVSSRHRSNDDGSDEENELVRLETQKNLKRKLPEDQSFKVNEYVIIAYQDNWYPGIVMSVKTQNEAIIRFMSRCKKPGYFQWPMRHDEQPVLSQFVLKKGFVPDCVNSGRQWFLSEFSDVENLYNLFKTVYF